MKPLLITKILITLTVAVAAVMSQAQDQPAPPPTASSDKGVPANIMPGSPLADVVKMIQAGVDESTIMAYVTNSQSAFNLDTDTILFLKDLGAPSDLINAMMDRDKVLYASTVAQPPPAPAPPPPADTTVADTTPPPTDVDMNYFNGALTPYGTWVNIAGYGRCWRPTAVVYDSAWNPYCDRGHWVYTDYGWYWDSDYSWGITFHYGRWFRIPRIGWCWYPDRVWAPSWVVWRSGGDYCGWAPLPPFAVYSPNAGFLYRGIRVAVDFNFGLAADSFVFLSPDHFCDRHPRYFCVDRSHVTQVFHQTTVVNNFNVENNTIVNHGLDVGHIASVTHRTIEPIHVSTLPNAGRQGWRGEGFERSLHISTTTYNSAGRNDSGHAFSPGNNSAANNQFRHGPEAYNAPGNTADPDHRETMIPTTPSGQPGIHRTENSQTQAPNSQSGTAGRVQTQNYNYNQKPSQQQQQQTRQINTYTSQGHTVSLDQWQQPQQSQQPRQSGTLTEPAHAAQPSQWQQNQWQQNRNYGTPANEGMQQHAASQAQQAVPPANQPHQDVSQNAGQSQAHVSAPPPSQGSQQGQSHNSGNVSSGSSNNGNSGSNGNNGSNKQNH